MDGMDRVDGCPECVLNLEPPVFATLVGDSWLCTYCCSDCGHSWTTSWIAETAQPRAKLVVTAVEDGAAKWDNESAPARCANTTARADPLPFTRTGRG